VTVLGWDDSGSSALARPCIQYNRTTGLFRVFQDGLYFICSHLAFDGPRAGYNGLVYYILLRQKLTDQLINSSGC